MSTNNPSQKPKNAHNAESSASENGSAASAHEFKQSAHTATRVDPQASEQPSEALQLQKRLAEKEAALKQAEAIRSRAQAEFMNTLQRKEKQLKEAHKYAISEMATELLSVIDNLERSIAHMGDYKDSSLANNNLLQQLHKGVELTLSSLQQIMKKYHIKVIDPKGEAFNPDYHEAISSQVSESVKPNHITDVVQKGYLLDKRLLRAAKVIVARKNNS